MKRRKFLKTTAHLACSSAYLYGLNSLMETILGNNLAQASSSRGLYYLNIQMPGGSPRWYFDQPLNPFNKNADVIKGNFGTLLKKSGSSARPILAGKKIDFGGQEVFMPPVWNLKSAATGIEFKDLLNDTMMIRGVNMELNSHTVNRTRIVRPVASSPSIHGLLADKSELPIAASGLSGTYGTQAFKSEKGTSIVQVNPGTPIPDLIAAFQQDVTKADELQPSTKQIISALDRYAASNNFPSLGAEKQQMAAYDMFARKLDSFNARWQGLYKKYRDIIAKEIRAPFPDVTDVGDTSDESVFYNTNTNRPVKGSLKSTIGTNTHINQTAQAFAFAEFALTENISSSVTVDASTQVMQGVVGHGNVTCDQHRVGSCASVFYTSLFYRSLLGCITELRAALTTAGIYDRTLIHIMSEFSRTPKKDGSGADHGFLGASTTLISGMISSPGLIGNIRHESANNSTKSRYPGTWGESGNFFPGENRAILNDDIVNTVCNILDLPQIAVKGQSLISQNGGNVEWAKKWELKNVKA